MPVYSATCYTTLSPSITVSLWAQNLPSENLILHQSVYVSQTDLIAVDCLPDFFCSSVFMVLFYFVLTFVILHVWQTKLASCLVNFLTHGNIMIDWKDAKVFLKLLKHSSVVHVYMQTSASSLTQSRSHSLKLVCTLLNAGWLLVRNAAADLGFFGPEERHISLRQQIRERVKPSCKYRDTNNTEQSATMQRTH